MYYHSFVRLYKSRYVVIRLDSATIYIYINIYIHISVYICILLRNEIPKYGNVAAASLVVMTTSKALIGYPVTSTHDGYDLALRFPRNQQLYICSIYLYRKYVYMCIIWKIATELYKISFL